MLGFFFASLKKREKGEEEQINFAFQFCEGDFQ